MKPCGPRGMSRLTRAELGARIAGLEADSAALKILSDAGELLIDDENPLDRSAPLGELLSPAKIEALSILNHAIAYLADREEYQREPIPRGYLG